MKLNIFNKNKKRGFTLIEIITCIALISLIGIGTIIGLNINKGKVTNDKDKKIKEAIEVYLATEKDNEGLTYLNGIQNGGKGLYFTVNDLYETGYLDEKTVSTLEKETKKTRNELKLLASESVYDDSDTACGTGYIKIDFSWTYNSNTEPIYLCPKSIKNTGEGYIKIEEAQNNLNIVNLVGKKMIVNLDKFAVSQEFYNNQEEKTNYVVENGIYTLYDEKVQKVYNYFRGNVENNYLKFGHDKEGKDLYWRILWLDNNNLMKIVLDDEIPVQITNKNGENITVAQGDKLYQFRPNSGDSYYIYKPKITTTREKTKWGSDTYYTYFYDKKSQVFNKLFMGQVAGSTSTNNIYYDTLIKWFENSTDLKTFENITSDKLCQNDYYNDDSGNYYPYTAFDCKKGKTYKENKATYNEGFYKGKIGHITYGDIIRSGVGTIGNFPSNSFLLPKNSNSYVTVDFQNIDNTTSSKTGERSTNTDLYYVTSTGVNYGTFYNQERRTINTDYYYYYTLINNSDEEPVILLDEVQNHGKNGLIIYEETFFANTVKPTMILDLNGKTLKGTGEKVDENGNDNSYIIVDKT